MGGCTHLSGKLADALPLVANLLVLDVITLALGRIVAGLEIILIRGSSVELIQALARKVTDLDIVAGFGVDGSDSESQNGRDDESGQLHGCDKILSKENEGVSGEEERRRKKRAVEEREL
jgi:hypothetical protein